MLPIKTNLLSILPIFMLNLKLLTLYIYYIELINLFIFSLKTTPNNVYLHLMTYRLVPYQSVCGAMSSTCTHLQTKKEGENEG